MNTKLTDVELAAMLMRKLEGDSWATIARYYSTTSQFVRMQIGQRLKLGKAVGRMYVNKKRRIRRKHDQ